MSVQQAIYDHLRTSVHVAALVGTKITDRQEPVGDPPYIVFQVVGDESIRSLAGATGLRSARAQLTAWAEDSIECANIHAAIRNRLDGYRGTVGGTLIHGVKEEPGHELFEEIEDATGLGRFGDRAEYTVWYAGSIPDQT